MAHKLAKNFLTLSTLFVLGKNAKSLWNSYKFLGYWTSKKHPSLAFSLQLFIKSLLKLERYLAHLNQLPYRSNSFVVNIEDIYLYCNNSHIPY